MLTLTLVAILVVYVLFAVGLIFFVFGGFLFGAMWMPLPKRRVKRMLELGVVSKGKVVFDLGAGFGNVAFEAAKLGVVVVAVEVDWFKVMWMRYQIKKKQLSNVKVLRKNLLDVDLSGADVLLCYLSDSLMTKIVKSILKENVIIVSASHKIKGLTPKKVDKDNLYPIYVY